MNENLDLSNIKKHISEGLYKNGGQLFEEKKTEINSRKSDINITTNEDSEFLIKYSSYTYGSGYNVYDQVMELSFRRNKLMYISDECDCLTYEKEGECKHVVSSLLTFFDRISLEELFVKHKLPYQEYLRGDGVDNIDQLLECIDYNEHIVQNSTIEYELIPTFRIEGDYVYMTLKIGKIGDRQYIVKNLLDLYKYFDYSSEIEYGKGCVIKHSIENFSNQKLVKEIVALLKSKYFSYKELNKDDNIQKNSIKEVYIKNYELQFFLTNLRDNIIFRSDGVERGYRIEEQKEKLKFSVSNDNNILNIKYKSIKSYLVNNKVYIFDNTSTIKEVSCKTVDAALILNRMLCNVTRVSQENLYNFQYSILRRLDEVVEFDNNLLYETKTPSKIITNISLLDDTLKVRSIVEENSITSFPLERYNQLLMINKSFCNTYDEKNGVFEISGISNIINYSQHALPQILKYSDEIIENSSFEEFDIDSEVNIDINLVSRGSKLLVDFKASKYSEEELISILKGIKTNDKYLKLKNNKYINLEDKQIVKIKKLAEEMNVDLNSLIESSFQVNSYNALYLDVLLEDMDLKFYKEKQISNMINKMKDFKHQNLEISKNIKVELRDYQQDGVNWLNTLREHSLNGILADDMGLGKTLQVIALLSSIKLEKASMIIAPTSLIYNWESEIKKFNPKLKYKIISGDKEEREKSINKLEDELVITSYELIRRDIDLYKEFEFKYVIIDEGQNIKNKNSQSAKAIKILKGEHSLVLTGTPIENQVSELWSIFDFIMPGYLGTYNKFKKEYENPIVKGSKNEIIKLQQKVRPFILRRLKQNVLTELPDKQEKVIYVEMEQEQQKVYDAQVLEVKNILNETTDKEFGQRKMEILAIITRMRQIVCNPRLVSEDYKGDIVKESMLLQMLSSLKNSGHKTLVFSQFVSNFKYLEQKLESSGISYYKIDGTTPKNIRHVLVDNFNSDSTDVFLISLKAGGTGLNITGADTVIHYDPWWNTAVESQATDRVYRMGQKNNVLVYKYICKNTIEEKILEMQERKKDLANNIIEGNNLSLSKMNKDDFIKLFE